MSARTTWLVGAVALALVAACGKSESSPPPVKAGALDPPSATAGAAEQAEPKATAVPAQRGLGADGMMYVGPDDRCPVCGMVPAKHAQFASAIALADKTTYYFCGTGCMIRVWLHPEVYLGKAKAVLARAVAPDYFTGKPIDATTAHWVGGSDVVGPMGPALVPLATSADADTFVGRHGGRHRFQLGEVDDKKWREVTGKPAVAPAGP